MSRFFRSPNSSDSGSDSSSDEEDVTQDISLLHLSNQVDTSREESLPLDRPLESSIGPHLGQDWLVHALLEEHCLTQVLAERRGSGSAHDPNIQREARERYHLLCSRLAPLNLLSAGLQDDRHRPTRQAVRDGLHTLQRGASPSRAVQRIRPNRAPQHSQLPRPLRRLLTDGSGAVQNHPLAQHFATAPASPASIFGISAVGSSLIPPRYASDFEEIGMLGKGGYGQVFHAKHRLDGRTYAVKKVPIRPSMVARIQNGGEMAMNELLSEVRSLSRLDHPNVVRYFSSWIEWSTKDDFTSSSGDIMTGHDESSDAVFGAEVSGSNAASLHRIQTESDADGSIGFTFESRNSGGLMHSEQLPNDYFDSPSARDGALLPLSGPTLALHMQMDVYPMTLADFISPPKQSVGSIAPLAHCFHLEPTIHTLQAILDGVEYIHSENVVHRDLKPANIFLRPENNPRAERGCVDLFLCSSCREQNSAAPVKLGVRIGDFGLVANIAQMEREDQTPSLSSSAAVGTQIYRPTSSKSNISPHLDIFALGIIACELLCRFDTQMERRSTLQDLRQGQFPKRFAQGGGQQAKAQKIKDCVTTMLFDEETTIADLKRRLAAVLEKPMLLSPVDGGSSEVVRRSST